MIQRRLIVDGKQFNSVESLAKAFALSRNTVDYRLSKGWSPEQAVGLQPRPSFAGRTTGVPVKVGGVQFSNLKEAARHFGRSYTYIFDRLKNGYTIEQALGLVKRADTLLSDYPDLARQWHPHKNNPLSPDAVTPHSGIKAWWSCPNGHEWQAVINSRARGGHGCPYCAGQRPTATKNFATAFPVLVKEWDFDKNQNIRPEECSPRSQNKVWWRCDNGHSWLATICNRTRKWKSTCPYCSNRMLCSDNSLARVRPDIAKDWHPNKNAPLTPNDVVAGGYKDVWWVCKHGHEWQAPVGRRVIAGSGCSKCALQTSRIEIAVYSEMVALFDHVLWREKISGYECDIYLPDKKIGIEVDGVYWHSRKPEQELKKSKAFEAGGVQLFRLREKGLQLLTGRDVSFSFSDQEYSVVSRLVGSLLKHAALGDGKRLRLRQYIEGPGLVNEALYRQLVAHLPAPPLDKSLAAKRPDIAREWATDLNAPLLPEHFRSKANKNVWWRCDNGHTWKTSINNRVGQGTGCPACPRKSTRVVTDENNLAFVYPNLAREWHPEKNGSLRPEDLRPKSNQKVWWQCGKGHEWQAMPASRAEGSGCPYCYGRFATSENNLASQYPELVGEWDREWNGGLSPADCTPHVGRKVWWLCKTGHSWQATVYNRTKNKSGCPVCARNANRRYSIADIQSIAKKRGGKCLSDSYTSCRAKVELSCKEGHTWETRADSVLYTDKWCPTCANGSVRLARPNGGR